eukprot:1158467-Pelagomonas_calceolata.AAC.6
MLVAAGGRGPILMRKVSMMQLFVIQAARVPSSRPDAGVREAGRGGLPGQERQREGARLTAADPAAPIGRSILSQLLTCCTLLVLSSDQVAAGFTRLLAAADDLVLDCPDVVRVPSVVP